eukprot:760853-Hanusia_phi.AAC.5
MGDVRVESRDSKLASSKWSSSLQPQRTHEARCLRDGQDELTPVAVGRVAAWKVDAEAEVHGVR